MIRLSPSDAPSFAQKATRPEIPRCGCTSDPFALHLEFRRRNPVRSGHQSEEIALKKEIIRVEPLSTYLERWKAPTSAVTRHGDTIYVSGLPPFDPMTGEIVDAPNNVADQGCLMHCGRFPGLEWFPQSRRAQAQFARPPSRRPWQPWETAGRRLRIARLR